MSFKPVQIFGFIMSFAYVFFGILFVMIPSFGEGLIEKPEYQKIFGVAVAAYGLFRVAYFLRQLRKKE